MHATATGDRYVATARPRTVIDGARWGAPTLLAILAAAALAATGCSPLTRPGTQKTITLAQARQRANSYAQQVSAALPGQPGLVPNGGGVIDLECGDPGDNGPQGRISAGGSFFLEPLSQDRIPEVFKSFRSYLTKRGFKVLTDQSDFLVMTNPKTASESDCKRAATQPTRDCP